MVKNKFAPFLTKVDGYKLKVVLNGSEVTEQYFDETFTQTAPRQIALAPGDRLEGQNGAYTLEEPIGEGAIIGCCIDGLNHIHDKGHLHRDIKPANILEFAETFKLGDLGVVKWSDFDPIVTQAGANHQAIYSDRLVAVHVPRAAGISARCQTSIGRL